MTQRASSSEQGAVALGIVILVAIVFSVTAFAALLAANSRAAAAKLVGVERLRAAYVAEAGIVWAMDQLWRDPTWSSGVGVDHFVPYDVNRNGTIEPGELLGVDVRIPACASSPCEDRILRVTVSY